MTEHTEQHESRLAGAGVALNDDGGAEAAGLVSLVIGDSATHVVLAGTLEEIHVLLDDALRQVAVGRAHRLDGA